MKTEKEIEAMLEQGKVLMKTIIDADTKIKLQIEVQALEWVLGKPNPNKLFVERNKKEKE